ncbi:MAG: gfo/Idh/MocA family oxidoreductase, partial [Pirellulales bacterium]|nr:gfo/Idh/MocA family oxidoreductase [Pirellulales bacterium]
MPRRPALSRRTFTGLAGAAGVGFFSGVAAGVGRAEGPHDKLSIAAIGVGGQGGVNLRKLSGQNIIAVCDVDERRAGKR